jgi:hypothetical protein
MVHIKSAASFLKTTTKRLVMKRLGGKKDDDFRQKK